MCKAGGGHIAAQVEKGYLSRPQAIEYPTTNDTTSHMFYYPPANQVSHKPPHSFSLSIGELADCV